MYMFISRTHSFAYTIVSAINSSSVLFLFCSSVLFYPGLYFFVFTFYLFACTIYTIIYFP